VVRDPCDVAASSQHPTASASESEKQGQDEEEAGKLPSLGTEFKGAPKTKSSRKTILFNYSETNTT
jgi:hypothetical protein